MKVLILDIEAEATGLDLALCAQSAGHEVQFWQPRHQTGEAWEYGDGLVERPDEWEPWADWADLIVVNGNSRYHDQLDSLVQEGYPVFGFGLEAARLELDRGLGQQALADHGVEVLPYAVVETLDDAIDWLVANQRPVVIKPWGGEGDKSLTFVTDSPEDAIFTLQQWKREDLFKGKIMLQDKVSGVEVGIAGWIGPNGFCRLVEESFEHKKLMNDEIGPSTGEQGTVIFHTARSKLYTKILKPLEDYLIGLRYVGDVSVNCIVDAEGTPWPLEFTCRLGHPDFAIRYEVIDTDPVEWMLDLVHGTDSFSARQEAAVGVVMAHGDYPFGYCPKGVWAGYPIHVDGDIAQHLHWQMVQLGKGPAIEGGKVVQNTELVTAGNYVVVATGSGPSVTRAQQRAYQAVESVRWPGDIQYRTDIGDKVRKALPKLHALGYCGGIEP